MSVLRNLFLYCSQFVARSALEDIFVLDSVDGYQKLKLEVLGMPDTFRNNDISDYIFGVNDQAVRQRAWGFLVVLETRTARKGGKNAGFQQFCKRGRFQ